jgi:arsenate reductase (glutaredoxin)
MLTVYHYPSCSTCKKALKWLDANRIEYKALPIVEKPPSKKALVKFLTETGLPVRKLFNTSGQLYREGGYKAKLETMTESQALDELATHGKLIKRPLVIGDGIHLVGFKEAEYEKALR